MVAITDLFIAGTGNANYACHSQLALTLAWNVHVQITRNPRTEILPCFDARGIPYGILGCISGFLKFANKHKEGDFVGIS